MCQRCVALFFRVSRKDVSYGLQQLLVIELVDPFECCELDASKLRNVPVLINDFSLEKNVDPFGEGIPLDAPTMSTEVSLSISARRSE